MVTYLSELQAREHSTTTRRQAASRTGLEERVVQTILSELTSSGILQAKIQIRCPECNSQHGIYSRRSEIPDKEYHCGFCDNRFSKANKKTWEVIYEITGDPDDFFRSSRECLEYYTEECRNLPASFFQSELERFRDRDDPSQRGRDFDLLIGLLFQQLPNVEVRLNGSSDTGEVDVYINCRRAPDRIYRMMGTHTMVENKWVQKPVQTKEISGFRSKTEDIGDCNAAYFVSMSGFTTGSRKQVGALEKLRRYENPRIIDLWEEDIEQMVSDGTPEEVLVKRMLK